MQAADRLTIDFWTPCDSLPVSHPQSHQRNAIYINGVDGPPIVIGVTTQRAQPTLLTAATVIKPLHAAAGWRP